LMVDNPNTARFLAQNLENECSLWVEIDTGSERTGIDTADTETLDATLEVIRQEEKLTLKGFYSHAGHSYACHGEEEIMEVYDDLHQKMMALRSKYIIEWPHLEINIGDTPCCSRVKVFEGIDSISPGNFVFYDLAQEHTGSCKKKHIAVKLACPVISKNATRQELVVYGGAIHLSKDALNFPGGVKVFGRTTDGCYVTSVSQEHGVIKATQEVFEKYNIGDIIYLLPIHSCLTAQCMGEYHDVSGEVLDHM
ncbi:MAG: alanine racemase, partial [Cyclobacteriaceae bacterium]|nr:alanine racemase [Cyclobacteriaceae bacterium]